MASAGHRAEPFTSIAFVDLGTGCQLCTGRWCLCQLLEEPEAIPNASHNGGGQSTGIAEHLAQKRFGFRLVDALLRCHRSEERRVGKECWSGWASCYCT